MAIILAMITNGYLFWIIPFLTLLPEYICPDTLPLCDEKDYCAGDRGVTINWNSTRSLHNWVEVYRLDCNILANHFI
jgi:hypothetical protein